MRVVGKATKRDIVDKFFSTESADIQIEMGTQIKIPNKKYVSMGTQTDDESTANESFSDYEYNSNESENEYHEVKKWENLKSLLKYCFICGTNAVVKKVSTKVSTRGSLVKVHFDCSHKHMSEWTSQTNKSGVSEGNMELAAGVQCLSTRYEYY